MNGCGRGGVERTGSRIRAADRRWVVVRLQYAPTATADVPAALVEAEAATDQAAAEVAAGFAALDGERRVAVARAREARASLARAAAVLDGLDPLPDHIDTVILMVPNSRIVESLVRTDTALLERLPAGSLIIDMSSSEPESTRTLAAAAAQHGIDYVDAPVSGGVAKAKSAACGDFSASTSGDSRPATSMPIAAWPVCSWVVTSGEAKLSVCGDMYGSRFFSLVTASRPAAGSIAGTGPPSS